MPIARVQQELTSSEWSRWQRFYCERPFGEAGADLRTGIATGAIVNALGRRRAKAIDYMPVIRNLSRSQRRAVARAPDVDIKRRLNAALDNAGCKHGGK